MCERKKEGKKGKEKEKTDEGVEKEDSKKIDRQTCDLRLDPWQPRVIKITFMYYAFVIQILHVQGCNGL